jgi:Zn-dependent protease
MRLSPLAARVVPRLDGTITTEELVERLCLEHRRLPGEVEPLVTQLVASLDRAGMFEGSSAERARGPVRRFAVLGVLLGPARVVGRALARAGRVGLALEALGMVAAVVLVFTAPAPHVGSVFPPALALILLAAVALHEIGHAASAAALGAPSQEAGVGLLFNVLPVVYVDRSAAVTLPSRLARAQVSLAGPAVDVLFAGVLAAAAHLTHGTASATLAVAATAEVAIAVYNLFPLLPTDGYGVLAALTGEIALAKNAREAFDHARGRRPLPPWLARSSRRRRVGLIAFYVASSVARWLLVGMFAVRIALLVLR